MAKPKGSGLRQGASSGAGSGGESNRTLSGTLRKDGGMGSSRDLTKGNGDGTWDAGERAGEREYDPIRGHVYSLDGKDGLWEYTGYTDDGRANKFVRLDKKGTARVSNRQLDNGVAKTTGKKSAREGATSVVVENPNRRGSTHYDGSSRSMASSEIESLKRQGYKPYIESVSRGGVVKYKFRK